jgi:chorismate dehydratase
MFEDERTELRIGAEPELFAAPLVMGLRTHSQVVFEEAPCQVLSDRLAEGCLDAALVPPLDGMKTERGSIIPGAGVCAEEYSLSECISAKVPFDEIGGIALSTEAKRSELLARVLLGQRDKAPSQGDSAVLLSGVPGLKEASSPKAQVHDLAAIWREHTGLPLVLAVWACRFRAPYPRLRAVLWRARQEGLAALPELAKAGATRFDIAPKTTEEYLGTALNYSLGGLEADSMRLFAAEAHRLGLEQNLPDLEFC